MILFAWYSAIGFLPVWKKDPITYWLQDAPSQTLQQSLKNLESSFKNFFAKRAAYPKFKKKGVHDSFRFPQRLKLEEVNNRLFLPKLGWLRYRNSRAVLGVVKNVTVSYQHGRWFAAIQTERTRSSGSAACSNKRSGYRCGDCTFCDDERWHIHCS